MINIMCIDRILCARFSLGAFVIGLPQACKLNQVLKAMHKTLPMFRKF
jgi:hypothetical protein